MKQYLKFRLPDRDWHYSNAYTLEQLKTSFGEKTEIVLVSREEFREHMMETWGYHPQFLQ